MSFSDKVQLVTVDPDHDGQRLDNFLMRLLKGVPRSRIYRIIRKGEVRVDKKRAKPEKRLAAGQQVRIPPFSGPAENPPPAPSPRLQKLLLASLLTEHPDYLVLNKPAGLAVHGGSGIRLGLIEAVRQMQPAWAAAELAHRLDRETSGCLLIALNGKCLKDLQAQFKARSVAKHYLALVHGEWPDELQDVSAALRKNEVIGGERIVRVAADGKPARTRFRVLQRFTGATLVEASPETGRTHQIRVHCQFAGHPIVGDDKYVQAQLKDEHIAGLASNRQLCLHAARLGFLEPQSGRAVEFTASLDEQFQGLLDRLSNNP